MNAILKNPTHYNIVFLFSPFMSEVNIILDILKAMLLEKPDSVFIKSLYDQYCNRGGLSKKQLEGLHSKASKSTNIPQSKLVTLQAIINKKPNRYKSETIKKIDIPAKDETVGRLLEDILAKHPAHKRILFLQSKYLHNDPLSALETEEIKKLSKLLLK